MDWIIFSVYRYIALPLVFAIAKALALLEVKNKFFETLQFRLKNKFHYKPTFDPQKKSIGIHAASGEIEYALPLIRKIKQLHPDYNIVVTLSSMSVLKAVMNQMDVDAVGPAPIDLRKPILYFLNQFQFKIFLFARTDVWPEISYQLNRLKIPSYLFSATFSKTRADKGFLAQALTRISLNNLKKILVVSESDKKNIESIKIQTPIHVTGDTRFDQVFYKKANLKKTLPAIPDSKKIFIAGSTWLEDENIVLPAYALQARNWRLILAPHEVHEDTLTRLEMFFQQHELKVIRLSQALLSTESTPWDVMIVDLYGYLFYLYAYADLTFVGGSFKAKVHSVMEPLSFFKPVCVGPHHTNNREAVEFSQIQMNFINTHWVQKFNSAQELENLLSLHTKLSVSEKDKIGRDLETLLSQHKGATERTYKEILFLL
ncbi:MAG: hypothetical protein JNL11_18575 [Bdellovibrionaceae bacterium]|nr:hypothetical protein [Pseudobdellovibrionaceae bacterium]